MQRIALTSLCIVLLIGSTGYGQSLADAARANRKQKVQNGNTSTKLLTDDDVAAPTVTIHLASGVTSTGDGMLVAPGRWKHGYTTTYLDATRFPDGGVLRIEITLGNGPAEASFDVYSQGARLPSDGFPNSLAGAHDVKSGSTAKIDYRFDHGTTFRFGAEGSWNAKAGDTNTYSIAVSVRDR